jgi:hypothetical protein
VTTYDLARLEAFEQLVRLANRELRSAILTPTLLHPTSLEMRDQLHPVANTENRDPEAKQLRIRARDVVAVHRGRSAGKDEAPRIPTANPIEGHRGRMDLAIDPLLTDPPGDELRELGPVVQDQDLVVVHRIFGDRIRDEREAFTPRAAPPRPVPGRRTSRADG